MSDPRYRSGRWKKLRRQVILRDGPVCAIVGCESDMSSYRMVAVDHIIEVKDGGEFWDPTNLQVLCTYHNREKGKRAWALRTPLEEPMSPNG